MSDRHRISANLDGNGPLPSPYGPTVPAAVEPTVHVPVMFSAGDVAHYCAHIDGAWRPACSRRLEVWPAAADPARVTNCPQCQAWARRARRAEN